MPQQSLGVPAAFSRKDIISELLDAYAYNDECGETSPTTLAPTYKELPPHPPRSDSLRDPKQEAIQRMNTQFQLRGKQALLLRYANQVVCGGRGRMSWLVRVKARFALIATPLPLLYRPPDLLSPLLHSLTAARQQRKLALTRYRRLANIAQNSQTPQTLPIPGAKTL